MIQFCSGWLTSPLLSLNEPLDLLGCPLPALVRTSSCWPKSSSTVFTSIWYCCCLTARVQILGFPRTFSSGMVFQKKLRTRRFFREACVWPGWPSSGGGGGGGGGGPSGGLTVLSPPWLGSFVDFAEGSGKSRGLTAGLVQLPADSSTADVTLAMISITLALTQVVEGHWTNT